MDWPHFNMGLVFEEAGDMAKAEACFRKVVELTPDDVEARCCLGNTLREQSRYDEALEQFRRARDMAPDEPMPWAELCLFYYECLSDGERALAAGRKFLELGGQDGDVEAVIDELQGGHAGSGPPGDEE